MSEKGTLVELPKQSDETDPVERRRWIGWGVGYSAGRALTQSLGPQCECYGVRGEVWVCVRASVNVTNVTPPLTILASLVASEDVDW